MELGQVEETNEPIAIEDKKTKACVECGALYNFKLESSKFCSDRCRVAHARKLKGTEKKDSNNVTVPVAMPLAGLPAHGQYIVNHLEKENARWEKKYEEEREAKKALKAKLEALKYEHEKLKIDNRIAEASKPSGLQGFMENIPAPILEHLGPTIAKLVDRFIPAAPNQIAGTNGQLDGESNTWANAMVEWFVQLPKESQHAAAGLIGELTKVPNDQLNDTIIKMINFFQNGTTITNPQKPDFQFGSVG